MLNTLSFVLVLLYHLSAARCTCKFPYHIYSWTLMSLKIYRWAKPSIKPWLLKHMQRRKLDTVISQIMVMETHQEKRRPRCTSQNRLQARRVVANLPVRIVWPGKTCLILNVVYWMLWLNYIARLGLGFEIIILCRTCSHCTDHIGLRSLLPISALYRNQSLPMSIFESGSVIKPLLCTHCWKRAHISIVC